MTIEQFLNTIKANQKGIENLSCDLLSKNCIFDFRMICPVSVSSCDLLSKNCIFDLINNSKCRANR